MSTNDASDRSKEDGDSSKDDEAAGDEIVISADEAHDHDDQDKTESSSKDNDATDSTAPDDADGDESETSEAETAPDDSEMVISAAEASDVNSGDTGPSAVLRYIKPVLYVLILAAALGGGYVAVQSHGGVPDVLPMDDNTSDTSPSENGSSTDNGDGTTSGDSTTPPEPSEPVFDTDELAATVMADINAYRDRHEVAVLFRDPALEAIAQNYSAYLAANDYVNRIDLEGQKPKTWIAAAGYDCAQQGETFLYEGDALVEAEDFHRDGTNLSSAQLSSDVVGQWRSEGRASDVLRQPYWDDAGIGTVLNGDEVIVTAVLC